MPDPTEEEIPRNQRQDAKRRLARNQSAMVQFMSFRDGRELMWDWLAPIFRTSFSVDSLQMAALEGERNAALKLLRLVTEAAPGSYVQMIQENQDAGK